MIKVFVDGNEWCALLGENLQEGLAGFSDTPAEALRELANLVELQGWNFKGRSTDMGSGRFPLDRSGWKRLLEAARLIDEVMNEVYDDIYSGESGGMQFDNAARDGGYLATLSLAQRLITEAVKEAKP